MSDELLITIESNPIEVTVTDDSAIIDVTVGNTENIELTVSNSPAPGLALGGSTGQILQKKSATDFDTEWVAKDVIPTKLSDLADDETHRTVTDTEKFTWNNSQGIPSGGAQGQVLAKKTNTNYDIEWTDNEIPTGSDKEIQFNDNGDVGASPNLRFDKVYNALEIGQSATLLVDNPLAIAGNIDSYLQVNIQNKNAGVDASADYIATADDGDDSQFYADLGICNSGYESESWDVVIPHDTYVFGDGGNVVIGSLTPTKKIMFFIGQTDHEAHPGDVVAEIDSDGINLPAGKTFRVNDIPVGGDIAFTDLTDAPSVYTGQGGKVVAVKADVSGLEFISVSGAGDMTKAVYDPNNKNANAFDADNHVSGTTNKVFSATEQSKLSGIAAGAEVNVQADWTAVSGDSFIQNKPSTMAPSSHNNTAHSETYITASSAVAPNAAITAGTKTKITYDVKGLVTSGADATTADIADSTNKRYCTDAEKIVIGNTSNTNTGDQTLSGLGGVPTTRTVNGHALSSDVTVSASDVGLGNVTNESKATMFTSPAFTGTPTGITASHVGALATSAFSGLAKISVGTSTPGSPSAGDLWIDTN